MAKRKVKMLKSEKLLYVTGIACFGLAIMIKIFLGASIGNFQINNEKLKFKIASEEKNIESLTMQVDELTSFDNVQAIVKNLGLAYNNDNIIVVND